MDGEEAEGRSVYAHAARIQHEDDERAIYTPATRLHSGGSLHIPQPPPSLAEQLKQVFI